jgi:hypothetical protein
VRESPAVSALAALVIGAAVTTHAHAQDSALVTPTLVHFEIPLGRDAAGLWHWNDPATPDRTAEYRFHVMVEGDTSLSIGFMLFKFPGAPPREGTCAELLRGGQSNLVLITGHLEQVVPGVRPALRCQGRVLVVELRDSATIARVFRGRPPEVTLEAMTPELPFTRTRVPIAYQRF